MEPGVLEGDRGELREPGEGLDLGLSEDAIVGARGQAEDADDAPTDLQRHADHRTDAAHPTRMPSFEGVVAVDEDRLAGAEHLATDALVDRHPEALVPGCLA